jgi:23S rRNA (adenine2503-C2)-methyltransferase
MVPQTRPGQRHTANPIHVISVTEKRSLYDLSFQEVEDFIASWDEKSFRSQQIWEGLYKNYWNSPDEFTPIPNSLRTMLKNSFDFTTLNPVQTQTSQDGKTAKTLFRLPDGIEIETVLMLYDQRRSLCISTQAGCSMGCIFCTTGQSGFKRNLTCGEIIQQVLYFAKALHQKDEKLTNIVIMGMGEPFLNYEQTFKALDTLNDPQGLNIGERRFTISTVGIIPRILQFSQEKRQINLAISLHAANNELRSQLLPINRKYPLEELIKACAQYIASTHRRITFEWALIDNVNDTADHARELVKLIKGLNCHVNLISLNPSQNYDGKGSSREKAEAFQQKLEKSGIPCTLRLRRGIEIQAGCGQLAGRKNTHS